MYSYGLGFGPLACSCEHDSYPSSSIKYCKFLELLSNCWLVKRISLYEVSLVMYVPPCHKLHLSLNPNIRMAEALAISVIG
jgi:hypothetical protein